MATTREKVHEIIFEADTKAGKVFDVALLFAIVISVFVVMLESVKSLDAKFHTQFDQLEWFFTIIFSIEYAMRIFVTNKPFKYIFSFYGIIDFLSIIPTYLGLFIGGAETLLVIRTLRLLRVFRVLKLTRYIGESNQLMKALIASRRKISVFLFAVLAVTVVMGTAMYLIEGGKNGFNSIPHSIYWAIVTLTTVGYGDISPGTWPGQFLASLIMILGYGIIAVPTGIVTSEMTKSDKITNTQVCQNCGENKHLDHSKFCQNCGNSLHL